MNQQNILAKWSSIQTIICSKGDCYPPWDPHCRRKSCTEELQLSSAVTKKSFEKYKDIEDSSQYDIGSRILQDVPVVHQSVYKYVPKGYQLPMNNSKPIGFMNRSPRSANGSKPPLQMKPLASILMCLTWQMLKHLPMKVNWDVMNVGRKATLNPSALN